MTVFISIPDMDNVMAARKYQTDAYKDFMTDKDRPASKEYKYTTGPALKNGHNDDDANVVFKFKIIAFDTTGLSRSYPSFCTLVNEAGDRYALSNDKDALLSFHVFRQRLLSVY